MKKLKSILLVMFIVSIVMVVFAAPSFAASLRTGEILTAFNPNIKAVITIPKNPAEAKLFNNKISAAWNSPLTDRAAIIAAGGTYTASNPFGIDTSPWKYDINTGVIIGPNPGYNQPIGYGETCAKAKFYTHNKPSPLPCNCQDQNKDE